MENLCALFKMYGLPHWIYLFVSVAVILTLVLTLRKQDKKFRFYFSKGIIGACALFVILEFVGRIISGADFMDSLPINPWTAFVIIAIIVEIKQSQSWMKFGYLISLPVCVVALFIVPNYYSTLNASNIAIVSYFMINMLIPAYALLKFFWEVGEVDMKDILNSSINYVIMIAVVHIFNVIARFATLNVHSNYFGTMGEDYDVIVKLLYGWIPVPLVHILPLLAILVGIEFLLFLPFNIINSRKEKKAHIEELVALGNLKAQQEARKNSKNSPSQILIRSEEKAKPIKEKNVTQKKSEGFLSVQKEVQVNRENKE